MAIMYTKMQGLGNDFILIKGPIKLTPREVVQFCDRQAGIGADGLLVVAPISRDKVDMQHWNADGSKAEMCGNGLRCVARFAVDNKLITPGRFIVETPAGPLEAIWSGEDNDQIEVQVGRVDVEREPLNLCGFNFYKASVGNPHAIAFVDDIDGLPVTTVGPKIEIDSHFPNRTNVEFVQILSRSVIKMRVWERGVGETKACGTGMVAAAVMASVLKGSSFPIEVHVQGGSAKIWLDDRGYSRMRSSALIISSGQLTN